MVKYEPMNINAKIKEISNFGKNNNTTLSLMCIFHNSHNNIHVMCCHFLVYSWDIIIFSKIVEIKHENIDIVNENSCFNNVVCVLCVVCVVRVVRVLYVLCILCASVVCAVYFVCVCCVCCVCCACCVRVLCVHNHNLQKSLVYS